jgi:DNA mismatch repair protein MutL
VEIERGGATFIVVSDDGCGMGSEDALLSLRRHATSKVLEISDLTTIRTFGFRGEALASIASVSTLRLQTRRAADDCGIELLANGGEIEQMQACALAPGTRIEVRNLFFNTPARLKFMKTVTTEQAAAAEVLQRLALANCRISFSLVADGRPLFDLPRVASLLERMRHLYGAKLAGRMLFFDSQSGALRVYGLTSMSQESLAAPRLIFTYVNNRPIRDRMLLRAIAHAYETLLPRGRYPAVALFVELPPEEVDVNVHPMKTEVRFRRGGPVFELVYSVLRERLKDQTTVMARRNTLVPLLEQPASSTTPFPISKNGQGDGAVLQNDGLDTASEPTLRLVAGVMTAGANQAPLGLSFIRPSLSSENSEANLAGTRVPNYSSLRVLGQLFAGFIVLEADDGLILVDQHAAHERVTFERLRAELHAGGIRVQPLLAPIVLELNPARAALAAAVLPELGAIGFEVEPFSTAALLLKGAPAVFGTSDSLKLLSNLLDSMGDSGFRRYGEGAMEEWLKTLACHGSLRVGRVLDAREISSLLKQLDSTEFKTNCPHGRPVHVEFRRGQLERMFRR